MMSLPSHEPPSQVETWSIADVHQWLTTTVEVGEMIADRFDEGEVLGEYLIDFSKQDILDLNIKHGPAVKIAFYLERRKQGLPHNSQIPAYVEKWSKEQVKQWLQQQNLTRPADRLYDEDVSGDCLVCFTKQDLMDVGIKSGPAVRILKVLKNLNNQSEPTLQPLKNNVDQKTTITQSSQHPKQLRQPPSEEPHGRRKDTNPSKQSPDQPVVPQITLEIQKTLADLSPEDFKSFIFHLKNHQSKVESIPSSKLSGKDTIDTASLMVAHYGSKDVLQVTVDILESSCQRELAKRLRMEMGLIGSPSPPGVRRREANQGNKLKDLLTCGGNSLDGYDRFVVVVNKSNPRQMEDLHFLTILKLFCVLDFDPASAAPGGLCHAFRETRIANLHFPNQYRGQIDTVIKDLNLFRQTSWIFCNGRSDIDNVSDPELDARSWLKKTCRDVENLISFIGSPDVLHHGRSLIIFLLLSPVTTNDPVLETYIAFLKNADEENVITICESHDVYEVWRELILQRTQDDISHRSVSHLTLREVNGTILALAPSNQSSKRLLPSSHSCSVVLKRKDEDLMTALDILCLNECENIHDENSLEYKTFRVKVEEEFYRGGKAKWWNFYFSDGGQTFVKREKHQKVIELIRNELTHSTTTCVQLNFFHHPGCGATTLAMHVLWDLRKELRCAVLKDNSVPKEEVANQVRRLMKPENETPTSVLLLVDDSKDPEKLNDLVHCIRKAAEECLSVSSMKAESNCKVIIIACVRCSNPREQYRLSPPPCQFITASLTSKEQNDFEKKLQELKQTHDKPENFYSFMIMKSNFDQKYVDDLAQNTLENFDFVTKKAKLFAFLALLNTYVDQSEISLSLCEDFLGMKMIQLRGDSIMDRMEPFSNLLIIEVIEDYGEYKGIRIIHHSIARACLGVLESCYCLKISDVAMEILHCDLLFREYVVKDRLMQSIKAMLISRERKPEGKGRDQFSHFIEKVHQQQGRQIVQEIFNKASARLTNAASIPQALARYLYIYESDFQEALTWAEKAKNIRENSYNLDTVGQVHKNHLKSNIDREKKEPSPNPDDLDTNIMLAEKGIQAFQRAQDLAHADGESDDDAASVDSEDYPRESYNIYGYVGVLEMAFMLFEILGRLPFFDKRDPAKKQYLLSFLQNGFPITSVYMENNALNERYVEIIKTHSQLLTSLKTKVKTTFEYLDYYFTYIKAKHSGFDSKNRSTVSALFKDYVELFCTTSDQVKRERESNPNLTMKIDIEEHRRSLEVNQADTFVGILQHLNKPSEDIEQRTQSYKWLLDQQSSNTKQRTKETINYILSNIVLYVLKPKSKHVSSCSVLSDLLLKTLQDIGLGYPFPDPYYLALLLLWPSPTQESADIKTYVTAIRSSSRKSIYSLYPKRSTVAHLFLGKGDGLNRLVSKFQLDMKFKQMHRDTLAQLWRSGDIFKEKEIIRRLLRIIGTMEQGEVFACYGQMKIPVRPALYGEIRRGLSTEKVSFYLGFAIDGPLAYDIQYVI